MERFEVRDRVDKKVILYIGGFELPDKNAAAQRVLSNAKIFKSLGFEVQFINYSHECFEARETVYESFMCFEHPHKFWDAVYKGHDITIDILKSRSDIAAVVAYNYPSLSLKKLINYCKNSGIACIGDIAEWYCPGFGLSPRSWAKSFDSEYRMRVLNKRCDGLIVISDYLEAYYSDGCIVNIPPLVDTGDSKWKVREAGKESAGPVKFIYAGSPSHNKERLDLICESIEEVAARGNDVSLSVVGIDEGRYNDMYGVSPSNYRRVKFHGRKSHRDTLQMVADSDFSIIIRDENKVTKAGFPTKFVESVSCGTAVIANNNSCIGRYVEKYECGYLVDADSLTDGIESAVKRGMPQFDTQIFDYRNYVEKVRAFMARIQKEAEAK